MPPPKAATPLQQRQLLRITDELDRVLGRALRSAMEQSVPYRVVLLHDEVLVERLPDSPSAPDRPGPGLLRPGTRVVAAKTAGFHRGAHGTVSYHAPDGRVWVRRDGATDDCYYMAEELELEEPGVRWMDGLGYVKLAEEPA